MTRVYFISQSCLISVRFATIFIKFSMNKPLWSDSMQAIIKLLLFCSVNHYKQEVWPPPASTHTGTCIGPRRLRLITWPCDLDLWPWRSCRLWLMRVVVLHPIIIIIIIRQLIRRRNMSIKSLLGRRYQVWSSYSLAVRKIWRTMCFNVNGDPDLWPFDVETGVRVASKVANLPSKFGHARPFGTGIIRYVRDGRTT